MFVGAMTLAVAIGACANDAELDSAESAPRDISTTLAEGDASASASDFSVGSTAVPSTTAAETSDSPAPPPETVEAATSEPAVAAGQVGMAGDASCRQSSGVVLGSLRGPDGITRTYRVYIPSGIGDAPVPAVLNFHGLGSNGDEQALYTGYESLAEQETFVVVHATGAVSAVNTWELSQFDIAGRDDVAFVGTLIDLLVADFCVDAGRVYSTGMSNGGLFSSQLICSMADRIAAAVSVAGLTRADDCEPSRPVPYMAIHGTADRVVSFDGKGPTLLGPGDPPAGSFFAQVMPEEFAEFAADFGCDADPAVSSIGDDVIEYSYTNCDDDVAAVFYEVTGGGHVWPGSPLAANIGGGYFTTDIDATADGWAFMRQFSL